MFLLSKKSFFTRKYFLLLMFLLLGCTKWGSSAIKKNQILWGGGGAFTSVVEFKNELYLSSDVAGVWKQEEGKWQPYINNLAYYNVTALAPFGERLFAITAKDLLYTDGNGKWYHTGIELDTYRSITDQAYTVSDDGKLMCIASRSDTIKCIDHELTVQEISSPMSLKAGVFFNPNIHNELLYFGTKRLYVFDFLSEKNTLLHEFEERVVALKRTGNREIVVTEKNIYDLKDLINPLYKASKKSIVSAIADPNSDSLIVGLGNRWNIALHKLTLNKDRFESVKVIEPVFDDSLPHRSEQRTLTKILSSSYINDLFYVTDYWGVYQLKPNADNELKEVSGNAFNIVATGLEIGNNHIYLSSMDVGIVKISKKITEDNKREIESISLDKIKGHAWSMTYFNSTLYAIFSPWEEPDDYLYSYSEIENSEKTIKLTNYEDRSGKGSFWGKSYSRGLSYYHGLVSFRDGHKGGLVLSKASNIDKDLEFSLGKQNKVYRAIEEHNGLLYIATCEGPATVVTLNKALETKFSIRLPSGFCAFNSYKFDGRLFLLGSRKGNSVIYEIKGKKAYKFYENEKGSAFYAMVADPKDPNNIMLATITWSYRPTSSFFVSTDGGETFTEKSCALTHFNGVVDIAIDSVESKTYILQKVGGLLELPTKQLFKDSLCD
ncbi:hypothetical protein [Glaciecola petra]|uniref:Lipoprotein n=1 Tax=Glaciecola petra TaxID=3075602 RepID=A0ABU2ZTH5_9ALTE|nr:hypothetical protein [Aestuariibacter sp. P117]MDT0595948.1 hypothetical protein [Aestuariibacter sp. P117]